MVNIKGNKVGYCLDLVRGIALKNIVCCIFARPPLQGKQGGKPSKKKIELLEGEYLQVAYGYSQLLLP